MSVKHLFKTTEIILLEERSNFDRKTNIGAQNSYYSYAERKTYRRENSKRDLKLFPTTSTPKHILRVITRGRSRPSKEAELGSQISGYNFPLWISKYLRITCPGYLAGTQCSRYLAATHDVTCPDATSSSSAALSTGDPYVTSSFSANDSTISRC